MTLTSTTISNSTKPNSYGKTPRKCTICDKYELDLLTEDDEDIYLKKSLKHMYLKKPVELASLTYVP